MVLNNIPCLTNIRCRPFVQFENLSDADEGGLQVIPMLTQPSSLEADDLLFFFRELASKLPIGKTEAEKTRRNDIFKQFDPNGNGFLSLAEIDKGIHDILGLDV